MALISSAVTAALSIAIGQAVTNLAQSTGLDYVTQRVLAYWRRHTTAQALHHAIQTAIDQFLVEMQQPALVRALQREPSFFLRPDVLALLGAIATTPAYRPQRMQQLGTLLHELAPDLRAQTCQNAARVLAECLYSAVMQIPTLRDELTFIQQEALRQHLDDLVARLTPLPPFEHELDRQLSRAAITLAQQQQTATATTAHLLYLLVVAPDTTTRAVFAHLHKTPQDVLVALGILKSQGSPVQPSLTTGARQALSVAQRMAGEQHEVFTRDVHVLEALLDQAEREGERGRSLTAVLQYLHLTPAAVRTALRDVTPTDSLIHPLSSIPQMETLNLYPEITPNTDEEHDHA